MPKTVASISGHVNININPDIEMVNLTDWLDIHVAKINIKPQIVATQFLSSVNKDHFSAMAELDIQSMWPTNINEAYEKLSERKLKSDNYVNCMPVDPETTLVVDRSSKQNHGKKRKQNHSSKNIDQAAKCVGSPA